MRTARSDDLNRTEIVNADGPSSMLRDPTSWELSPVTIYFRDLKPRVIEFIGRAEIIVGCVAWMTEPDILSALAKVPHGVSIIVQKEDFLRPDANNKGDWKSRLREQYGSLPYPPDRLSMPGIINGMSCCSDPTIQPVRCAGMGDHGKVRPNMHHKFLVACRAVSKTDEHNQSFLIPVPFAVWTGSANLTANSIRSLENAIVIESKKIGQAYYAEWAQIAAISEPLDWDSEWVAPEWRIGT
jgi:hypothetical protein